MKSYFVAGVWLLRKSLEGLLGPLSKTRMAFSERFFDVGNFFTFGTNWYQTNL